MGGRGYGDDEAMVKTGFGIGLGKVRFWLGVS